MSAGISASEYKIVYERLIAAIWDKLEPLEGRIEDEETIPHELVWPVLKESGAFGLLVPAEYGGSGLSIAQYLPLIAEFAKVHGGIRALVHVHNSFAHALSVLGDSRQKEDVLPGAAVGDRSLAFALTEPEHGTGADLGTQADWDGRNFIVTGQKHLITNSDFASHFLVMAKTAEREVSAILVKRDSPGLTIEPLPETMGCKGGEHGQLTFDHVQVPRASLVGELGDGEAILERSLEISRVLVAASSLGTSERALELSVQRSQERVTFSKPIGSRQAIQRYIAEMAIDVYALRGMLADCAKKWDEDKRIPAEASMCKQFGLEAVGRVTDRALLVHGGLGYTRHYSIERLYRDARLNWIEEGTPTIQYMVTASEMLDGYQFDDAFGGPGRENL